MARGIAPEKMEGGQSGLATIGPTSFPFTGDGDNVVDKPRFEGGKVWINAPEISWASTSAATNPPRNG